MHVWVQQTSAVVSVEERHENDRGLLLFSLKHVAVLRPVSLLQDFVIYLGKWLLQGLCVISGESQGLCREQSMRVSEPPVTDTVILHVASYT